MGCSLGSSRGLRGYCLTRPYELLPYPLQAVIPVSPGCSGSSTALVQLFKTIKLPSCLQAREFHSLACRLLFPCRYRTTCALRIAFRFRYWRRAARLQLTENSKGSAWAQPPSLSADVETSVFSSKDGVKIVAAPVLGDPRSLAGTIPRHRDAAQCPNRSAHSRRTAWQGPRAADP